MTDPIVHLACALLLIGIGGSFKLPTRAVLAGAAGMLFLTIYAPAACLVLLFVYAQGIVYYIVLKPLPRGNRIRKYAPYLLLLNLLSVDFVDAFLNFEVIIIGVSFSIIRGFIALKEFLNIRKKLGSEYYVWSFVALFFLPTLIIGPIFSAHKLWIQSGKGQAERNGLSWEFRTIAFGLTMAAVASPFFTKLVERAPEILLALINKVSPSLYGVSEAYLAVWFFPAKLIFLFLALFTAFWGQSLIAERTTRLYGFQVPSNFDHPWKAIDIRDFWRRWHISMAEFVKNYIFIPLNLAGVNARVSFYAAFIFMGLWHNISLGYLLWGIGHGTLLAFWPATPENPSRLYKNFSRLATFICVVSLSYVGNYAFN